MTDDGTTKVAELVDQARICMLTTMTTDGRHVSRPMALQEVEFDGDLWFFAERGWHPVQHVQVSPQVDVGVGSGGTWVSLTGHATVVDDLAEKKELWNGAVEAWFPNGPEDPDVVPLKVDGDSAEFWDGPGGRLATAFSLVKAKATGERIDSGENEKVEF